MSTCVAFLSTRLFPHINSKSHNLRMCRSIMLRRKRYYSNDSTKQTLIMNWLHLYLIWSNLDAMRNIPEQLPPPSLRVIKDAPVRISYVYSRRVSVCTWLMWGVFFITELILKPNVVCPFVHFSFVHCVVCSFGLQTLLTNKYFNYLSFVIKQNA